MKNQHAIKKDAEYKKWSTLKQTCELMSCISEHSYSSQMLTKLHNNISQHDSMSRLYLIIASEY